MKYTINLYHESLPSDLEAIGLTQLDPIMVIY